MMYLVEVVSHTEDRYVQSTENTTLILTNCMLISGHDM